MATKGSYSTGATGGMVESTVESKASYTIGAYTLNPEYYEPQRSNAFEFLIYDIDGLTPAVGASNKWVTSGNNAQTALRLSVESCNIPHYSQSPLVISRGNTDMRFAGRITFSGTISVTFVDYMGAGTLEALMAWQQLSGNLETEKVGLAKDYKKKCTLTEYTPTWQPVRSWELTGCWISELSEQELSYTGADKRTITATIAYDYAKLTAVDDANIPVSTT